MIFFKVPKEESEQDFDTKYFGAYKDKAKELESSLENAEMSGSRLGSKRLESILKDSEAYKRKSTSSTKRDSIQIVHETKSFDLIGSETTAGIAPSVPETIQEAPEGVVPPEVMSLEERVKSEVLFAPSEQMDAHRCLHNCLVTCV